jgi:hypothetical protein
MGKLTDEERKENKRLKDKERYLRNKEKFKEQKKQYYILNKEKYSASNKKHHSDNKDKISKRKQENYIINKDKILAKHKLWYNENKEKVLVYNQNYSKNRMETDELYKFKDKIRRLIRQSFNKNNHKKQSSTTNILGCTFEEFKKHIESLWQPWMNWDNYGLYNGELNYGWDIDHIIPQSNATNLIEMTNLNHYSNLQPLCSYINRKVKLNKII